MADGLSRRNGVYQARTKVNGKTIRESLRTRDREEAKRRLKAWKAKISHEQFYGENRLTWQDAATRYITEVMPGGVKLSTATRYKVSFRMVAPHLEGTFMDQIKVKDIATLVGKRKKEGASNATVKRDLTAVSRVCASARSWGAMESNPARDYLEQGLVRERRDPIVLPTLEEVQQAIEKAPDAHKPILEIARTTGMRQGEIISMHPRQVDTARLAISLDKSKTDSPRVISLQGPLLREAVVTLEVTLTKNVGDNLFPNMDGDQYVNYSSNFNQWAKRAKVRFRFHDLRHFFAVSYLRAGGNIYDLQKTLGHKSIKTTEIYLAYLTPEEQHIAKHGVSQKGSHI